MNLVRTSQCMVWAAALTCSITVYSAEYYVDVKAGPGGDGSEARPWNTIATANAALQAGDTVFLRGGVYREPIKPANSGTAEDQRIVYQAYPGETPELNFGTRLTGWTRYKGQVWRTKGAYSRNIRQGTYESNGPDRERAWKTVYFDRNNKVNRITKFPDNPDMFVSGGTNVDGDYAAPAHPGDSFRHGGYIYVRTIDSDDPNRHEMVALGGTNAIDVSNRSFISIRGIKVRDCEGYVVAPSASHISVENSDFSYGGGSGGYIGVWLKQSSHIIIRNNRFAGLRSMEQHSGNMFSIEDTTNSLIEGNQISLFPHGGISFRPSAKHNVIRGNVFSNATGKPLELTRGSDRNLIEYNIFKENANPSQIKRSHPAPHAVSLSASHSIVRFNEFYNNSRHAQLHVFNPYSDTRNYFIYNNTMYGSQAEWNEGGFVVKNANDRINPSTGKPYTLVEFNFINNIVAEHVGPGPRHTAFLAFGKRMNFHAVAAHVENNIFYSSRSSNDLISILGAGLHSVAGVQAALPEKFKHNIQANPKITKYDPESPDFRLQNGSPAIDAGRYLTVAVDSGSGTSLKVGEAGFFWPGSGVTPADRIQVGSQAPVRLVKIDYPSNTLTLAQPVTWRAGDPVSLPYKGSRPDIGAHEFGIAASGAKPSAPARLQVQ